MLSLYAFSILKKKPFEADYSRFYTLSVSGHGDRQLVVPVPGQGSRLLARVARPEPAWRRRRHNLGRPDLEQQEQRPAHGYRDGERPFCPPRVIGQVGVHQQPRSHPEAQPAIRAYTHG